jgi:hypothetical protein
MDVVTMWTGFMWLKLVPVAGSCDHSNEPKISLILGDYKIQKKMITSCGVG